MISTAQQVIDQALSLIGVKSTGSVITAEEYQDCLYTLNSMIDRWNLTDLLVYAVTAHTFDFVPGKQMYTLGTGGDFDMPRPANIERLSVLIPGGGYPIEIPLDAYFDLEAWQGIVVKNMPSTWPLACYTNTGFPYMELNFWPIPQGPAQVKLYTWDLMPYINNLVDNVELPTGYTDAIVYNLAVRLAQLFDRVPTPELVAEAKQAKHDINDINDGTPKVKYGRMWSGGRDTNSLVVQSWGRVAL